MMLAPVPTTAVHEAIDLLRPGIVKGILRQDTPEGPRFCAVGAALHALGLLTEVSPGTYRVVSTSYDKGAWADWMVIQEALNEAIAEEHPAYRGPAALVFFNNNAKTTTEDVIAIFERVL